MDVSSTEWLQFMHEAEMEDSNLICQCRMDLLNHSLDELCIKCFSPEVFLSYTSLNNDSEHIETSQTEISKLAEEVENNKENSQQFNGNLNHADKLTDEEMMSEEYINFSSLSSQISEEKLLDTSETSKMTKTFCSTTRAPLQARNHILAERKRRERLNQKLISLATLLPGLKKMDKASILENAIRYVKQLKENVQTLEKEAKKKLAEPSTVLSVKRCRPSSCGTDDTVLSNKKNFKESTPEIAVRVSDKNVLVRIHCEKSGGLAAKILSEIQALHLNVISSTILTFGNNALDITIIAQMDEEFHMTVKDLVENVRLAVLKFTLQKL